MALVLYQFVADFDLPNPSPFCFKVETFLRMTGLPYEVRPWSPARAPTGKAPVISLDGEVIGDSSAILQRLIAHHGLDIDQGHDHAAYCRGRAAQRLLEEHTYWVLLHERWARDEGWAHYRPIIGGAIPAPALIKPLLLAWLRRGVVRSLHAQGLGRHPRGEIVRRGVEDLQSVEALLGEGPFIAGPRPCSLDASIYAFLESLAHPLGGGPLRDHLLRTPALVAYRDRMRALAWPDHDFPS